ncbi:hypothetical protein H6G45_15920 [Synechocystis sp. FACHB-383]|nr:hypothetical protein [Synechocystis sp. FACHB-383]MBD2654940.1 hypothetical protein [Synechocystis sp. FACHB-383]
MAIQPVSHSPDELFSAQQKLIIATRRSPMGWTAGQPTIASGPDQA